MARRRFSPTLAAVGVVICLVGALVVAAGAEVVGGISVRFKDQAVVPGGTLTATVTITVAAPVGTPIASSPMTPTFTNLETLALVEGSVRRTEGLGLGGTVLVDSKGIAIPTLTLTDTTSGTVNFDVTVKVVESADPGTDAVMELEYLTKRDSATKVISGLLATVSYTVENNPGLRVGKGFVVEVAATIEAKGSTVAVSGLGFEGATDLVEVAACTVTFDPPACSGNATQVLKVDGAAKATARYLVTGPGPTLSFSADAAFSSKGGNVTQEIDRLVGISYDDTLTPTLTASSVEIIDGETAGSLPVTVGFNGVKPPTSVKWTLVATGAKDSVNFVAQPTATPPVVPQPDGSVTRELSEGGVVNLMLSEVAGERGEDGRVENLTTEIRAVRTSPLPAINQGVWGPVKTTATVRRPKLVVQILSSPTPDGFVTITGTLKNSSPNTNAANAANATSVNLFVPDVGGLEPGDGPGDSHVLYSMDVDAGTTTEFSMTLKREPANSTLFFPVVLEYSSARGQAYAEERVATVAYVQDAGALSRISGVTSLSPNGYGTASFNAVAPGQIVNYEVTANLPPPPPPRAGSAASRTTDVAICTPSLGLERITPAEAVLRPTDKVIDTKMSGTLECVPGQTRLWSRRLRNEAERSDSAQAVVTIPLKVPTTARPKDAFSPTFNVRFLPVDEGRPDQEADIEIGLSIPQPTLTVFTPAVRVDVTSPSVLQADRGALGEQPMSVRISAEAPGFDQFGQPNFIGGMPGFNVAGTVGLGANGAQLERVKFSGDLVAGQGCERECSVPVQARIDPEQPVTLEGFVTPNGEPLVETSLETEITAKARWAYTAPVADGRIEAEAAAAPKPLLLSRAGIAVTAAPATGTAPATTELAALGEPIPYQVSVLLPEEAKDPAGTVGISRTVEVALALPTVDGTDRPLVAEPGPLAAPLGGIFEIGGAEVRAGPTPSSWLLVLSNVTTVDDEMSATVNQIDLRVGLAVADPTLKPGASVIPRASFVPPPRGPGERLTSPTSPGTDPSPVRLVEPDVTVEVTSSVQAVNAGQEVSFAIEVANTGRAVVSDGGVRTLVDEGTRNELVAYDVAMDLGLPPVLIDPGSFMTKLLATTNTQLDDAESPVVVDQPGAGSSTLTLARLRPGEVIGLRLTATAASPLPQGQKFRPTATTRGFALPASGRLAKLGSVNAGPLTLLPAGPSDAPTTSNLTVRLDASLGATSSPAPAGAMVDLPGVITFDPNVSGTDKGVDPTLSTFTFLLSGTNASDVAVLNGEGEVVAVDTTTDDETGGRRAAAGGAERLLTWTGPPLKPGASRPFALRVRVSDQPVGERLGVAGEIVTANATLAAKVPLGVEVPIDRTVDLTAALALPDGPLQQGARAAGVLTVRNLRRPTAIGTTIVIDHGGALQDLQTNPESGWSCDRSDARLVTCGADVGGSGSGVLRFSGLVAATPSAGVRLKATVSNPNDPDPAVVIESRAVVGTAEVAPPPLKAAVVNGAIPPSPPQAIGPIPGGYPSETPVAAPLRPDPVGRDWRWWWIAVAAAAAVLVVTGATVLVRRRRDKAVLV